MDPEPDQYGYGSLGKQWKPCFSFYVLSCKILHRVEGRNELSYTMSLKQSMVWRQHSASSMYIGLVLPVRTRYIERGEGLQCQPQDLLLPCDAWPSGDLWGGGKAFQGFLLPDGNGNHANHLGEDLTTARRFHQWWRKRAHGEREAGAFAYLQHFLSPSTVISPGTDQLEKSISTHSQLQRQSHGKLFGLLDDN